MKKMAKTFCRKWDKEGIKFRKQKCKFRFYAFLGEKVYITTNIHIESIAL